jgi:hypothetical protein
MHIITPFFPTCSDPTCMREREELGSSDWIVKVFIDMLWFLPFHGYLTRGKKNVCAIISRWQLRIPRDIHRHHSMSKREHI